MEESRNYILAVCSFAVAALTVYGILRLTRYFAGKDQKARAVCTSLVILMASGGMYGMHLFGKSSLSGLRQAGGSLFISLALYALTLLALLYLFTWGRQILAEREQLKELAYRDSLTGLLNKNGLDHFWQHCKPNEQVALFYLDLNRFKSINDNLGHHTGDLLLQAVGGRLRQFSCKGKRHIFRIGGDEFVMIAKRCSSKEAEKLALQILENTTRNYSLDRHELFVSASIGITTSQGRLDPARLLKEADSAMYSAKQLGSGRYAVYKQGNTVNSVKWVGSSRTN
ncbi:GGDEF domain-containing protein [Paenibacillus sp. PK3_47]|uniref:GGDEF domain-containing protein n=1 Tax=Paenibacillus sp. PK3_47 TaxID=2072642 RepID=UPI00201D91D4|nr:GGDEF domain-containing protein [Paenibacillus sp. PK3_47]UQZ35143.1 GGDEF domain-containing protein [Paenibacillus sp. PK3_47]